MIKKIKWWLWDSGKDESNRTIKDVDYFVLLDFY